MSSSKVLDAVDRSGSDAVKGRGGPTCPPHGVVAIRRSGPTRWSAPTVLVMVVACVVGRAQAPAPVLRITFDEAIRRAIEKNTSVKARRAWRRNASARMMNEAAACTVGFFSIARRSEEHTSELQSRFDLVCRLLL